MNETRSTTRKSAPSANLVAVVVTHNRQDKLAVTLGRLTAVSPDLLTAIVVVDNCSSDATGEVIAGHVAASGGRVVARRSPANLGGAGGFELGMRLAVETFDPDWIVVMDDDAYPAEGALGVFHALDRTGWDALAAAVSLPSGEVCEMNRPSRNPFWSRDGFLRLVRHVLSGRPRDGFHVPRAAYDGAEPLDIDAASFVGLFLSRSAVQRAGYPDPRLFIYGDDVLYTLALREAGGRIGFHPRIRFVHDFSTISSATKRHVPLWKGYYLHRNLLIVYRRSAGWMFWPALMLILPKWIVTVRHHAGERRAYLRLLARAVRDGILGRLDAQLSDIQELGR